MSPVSLVTLFDLVLSLISPRNLHATLSVGRAYTRSSSRGLERTTRGTAATTLAMQAWVPLRRVGGGEPALPAPHPRPLARLRGRRTMTRPSLRMRSSKARARGSFTQNSLSSPILRRSSEGGWLPGAPLRPRPPLWSQSNPTQRGVLPPPHHPLEASPVAEDEDQAPPHIIPDGPLP